MYITCQECDTTYRLDEHLLNPDGSKVRCSQCGYIFVARPPEEPSEFEPPPLQSYASVTMDQSEEKPAEEELDGIDMAELDSILGQDMMSDTGQGSIESELDDLELDEPDSERSEPDKSNPNPKIDELDLEMNFELDDDGQGDLQTSASRSSKISENNEQSAIGEVNESLKDFDEALDDFDLNLDFDDTLTAEADKLADSEGPTADIEDLALDELDLDFEEPAEAEAAPKAAADDDPEDIDDLVLDELDLDLEEPATVEATQSEVAADDDKQKSIEEINESLKDFDEALDDLDLNLDFDDTLMVEADKLAAGEASSDDIDDLDLTDLDLDLDEPAATEAAADDLEGVDDLALDELDLDLDEPAAAEASPAEAAADDLEGLDDLTLDELDLDESDVNAKNTLSEETAEENKPEEKKEELINELDLNLDLDLDLDNMDEVDQSSGEEQELSLDTGFEKDIAEVDEGLSAEAETTEEEFDLSDLVEFSGQDTSETESEENSQTDELTLALESDEKERAGDETDGEELEDLQFELDSEFEEKPVAHGTASEPNETDEEDLDFSDLEQMLESDGMGNNANLEDVTATTGLDVGDKWGDSSEGDIVDEIDLSEIENAIDGAENNSRNDGVIDEELDLDLSFENDNPTAPEDKLELELEPENIGGDSPSDDIDLDLSMEDEKTSSGNSEELELELELDDSAPQAQKSDYDDEFDLSELDDLIDKKAPSVKADTIDTGDIELEFHVEDELEEAAAPAMTGTAGIEPTRPLVDETIEAAPDSAKPAKQKRGTSKGVVVLFIIVLLGAGGYFGWNYMQKSGMQIPYISKYIDEYLHPKPKDPMGTLHLSTQEINSKFIENEKNGRLFVITGKVLNQYPTARGMIRLQGNLYTKGKILAKSEKTFAGFQVSDQDLANLPFNEIKARLSTPPKPQDTASNAAAGQAVPFMVVFSDLPGELDEFAIELVSSTQVQ